jgi:iron complex outermembrane receptor protein
MVDGKKRNMNSGELKNSGIELESRYRITDHLSASANYSYLNMKNPVFSAPEHKLYAEIDLLKNRSRFTTGVQYVAGLYTDITPGNIQQEQYVLWNARYSFIINKNISLYIKGENLLNSKYETLSGYPMPGTTVMSGIKIGF